MTSRPEPGRRPLHTGGHERIELTEGWEAAPSPPGAHPSPAGLGALAWAPARVPGTAAAVAVADAADPDEQDWWFRTRLDAAPPAAGERVVLRLEGVATLMEAYLDGELLLRGESMFAAHEAELGSRLRPGAELAVVCRALAPRLRERLRPRARWRTRVGPANLRFFRASLLGRAPGFSPGPAPVGPWRPVAIERRRGVAVHGLRLIPRLDGEDGVLAVALRAEALGDGAVEGVAVTLGGETAALALGEDGHATGELRIPSAARWWPHTHGTPVLHGVRLRVDTTAGPVAVDAGRIGFRELAAGAAPDHDVERDGLDLHVNGERVFARGAVWTPVDPIGLAPDPAALREALEQVRDAGLNLLRVPGIGVYESPAFHDLCDELGILVWQDLMLANYDYEPVAAAIEAEVGDVAAGLAGRPSLAVVCGNSEVEQQVAMLGLDPSLGRGELFGRVVPEGLRAAGLDAVYVPSAPSGGALPFRPATGIANYYGVGAYRRPLEDARHSGVRFAAECLAFANVPDDALLDAHGMLPHDPAWKAGVPRDVGSGWDFDDVRDHYLAELFGVSPEDLRRSEPARYLELSRAVTGEVMAEVLGEWRRAGSPSGGGLVLWLRDVVPGAGWGLVDAGGEPKLALHHVRRASAPLAVWTTDEGLNGVAVHVANDGPAAVALRLRVALYGELEQRRAEAAEVLELPPRGTAERDVEAMLGHFVDASNAYRFGPPGHDAIVASLERGADGAGGLVSQAFRFPAGRPLHREAAARLGLTARAEPASDGTVTVVLATRMLAYGVRIHADGFRAGDDGFSIEPGGERRVRLHPVHAGAEPAGATVSALNLRGRIPLGGRQDGW
jgi:beta-mannosidase